MHPRKRISLAFIALFTIATFINPAAAATGEAATLTDQGVQALSQNKNDIAISFFEKALKVDPEYKNAKLNLAIADNNLGMSLAKKLPQKSLTYMCQALFLKPDDVTIERNINWLIEKLGKDPKSVRDRIALAEQANNAGEFREAIIEYSAALQIMPDEDVSHQIDRLFEKIGERRHKIKYWTLTDGFPSH